MPGFEPATTPINSLELLGAVGAFVPGDLVDPAVAVGVLLVHVLAHVLAFDLPGAVLALDRLVPVLVVVVVVREALAQLDLGLEGQAVVVKVGLLLDLDVAVPVVVVLGLAAALLAGVGKGCREKKDDYSKENWFGK